MEKTPMNKGRFGVYMIATFLAVVAVVTLVEWLIPGSIGIKPMDFFPDNM